jgi:hypothetical protein
MTPSEQAALTLTQTLDAIRTDLTLGRLDNVALHSQQIEQLLPQLEGLTDAALAQRLRDTARRNEACLAAARRGVMAARQRLADVLAAAQGFATYDGQGRRAVIEAALPQLAQRI